MRAAVRDYIGRECKPELLAAGIEKHFQIQGYQTQRAHKDDTRVIQARKVGVLRELLAADKAFTVTVMGGPSNLRVSFGIGKWFQNIKVEMLEEIAIGPIVTFLEIPVSLWSYETEREFWAYVERQVELRV